MFDRTLLCLALLSASGATAATSAFLLGVDYSEWLTPNARQIATDNSGALYILSAFPISTDTPPSSVTKLSADGKTILWQNQLGFAVSTMAVDPNGGVYVAPVSLPTGSAGDGGPATSASLFGPWSVAVDGTGDIYIGGQDNRVRKVSTAGIITTVAGNGTYRISGDGGLRLPRH